MKYEVDLKAEKRVTIEAEDAREAAELVRKDYPDWWTDEIINAETNERNVVFSRCQVCEKDIFEDDDFVSDVEGYVYCAACEKELPKAEVECEDCEWKGLESELTTILCPECESINLNFFNK